MGKRGDKWAQTGGGWAAQDWEESKPPKWRLWSGASPKAEGRPPWRKGAGKTKDSSGKTQFPAYDARRPEDMTIVPVQELRTSDLAAAPSTGPSLISLIQGAVNQARKLDARMNKLQKDLTDGRLQWDAYVADLKTALKTQKARFLQEQERITKELHHTKELREQAYRQLKPFNAGGSDTGPTAMELSQDIEEWNEIARELDAPPDGKADGPLLKLMQALQQAGVSMESTMPAVPATPPRRETQVPPATPPHATKTLAQARSPLSGGGTPTGDEALKDPYLSSPGLAHFGVHSASAGPVAGAMPAAPAASNVEAQRGENASEMLRMLAREPPPGLRNASPRNVEQRGVPSHPSAWCVRTKPTRIRSRAALPPVRRPLPRCKLASQSRRSCRTTTPRSSTRPPWPPRGSPGWSNRC